MSIAPEALARLEVQVQQAEDCWRRGDFDGALRRYHQALSDRLAEVRETRSGFVAADLVVMDRTADLAVLFGHGAAADQLLESVCRLAADAGNEIVVDLTQLKRVEVALSGDNPAAAHHRLRDLAPRIGDIDTLDLDPAALRRWEQTLSWAGLPADERAMLYTRLYLVMGRILTLLGQYRDAIATLDRGLDHAQSQPAAYAAATIVLRLFKAQALLEYGELDAAYALLAENAGDAGPASQPGHRVHRLELLAKLLLLRGNFGAAITAFRETCDVCERGGFATARARAAVNLSHVLILVNQTQSALDLLGDAATIATDQGDRALADRVVLLRVAARARATSLADEVSIERSVTERWERRPRAPAPSESSGPPSDSISDVQQASSFLSFFEDRALLLHLCLSRGDLRGATERLEEMRTVFVASDSPLIAARLAALGGVLAYYGGEIAQAKGRLEAALPQLDALQLTPDRWQVLRMLSWCSVKLGEPADAARAPRDESQALLDQMTRSLDGADRAVFLLNKWTQDEEFLAGQIDELVALRAASEAAPWHRRPFLKWRLWKALLRIQTFIDRYKALVAQRAISRSDVVGDWGSVAPASLLRTWRALKRNQARLTFLVLPDRTLLITTRRFRLAFGISRLTRIELRDLVTGWHRNARLIVAGLDPQTPRGRAVTDQLRRSTETLARELQIDEAVDELPSHVRTVRIVPDDCLHGFPFAAIEHRGRFLVERVALAIDFESNPELPRRSRAGLSSTPQDLLLVGVSRGNAQFPTLPGVIAELDEVEACFDAHSIGVRRWDDWGTGAAPTRAAIIARLPGARFLHVACHGVFRADEPDRSGLLLDPSTTDGMLTVRDIATLNLSGMEHATLSACWSGDHFVVPGRWIIGLPELLWRAGVRSILAALWPLHDALAVSCTTRFYDLLSRVSREDALRDVQLACIRGELAVSSAGAIDQAHPVYWAGLVLFGSGAPLERGVRPPS